MWYFLKSKVLYYSMCIDFYRIAISGHLEVQGKLFEIVTNELSIVSKPIQQLAQSNYDLYRVTKLKTWISFSLITLGDCLWTLFECLSSSIHFIDFLTMLPLSNFLLRHFASRDFYNSFTPSDWNYNWHDVCALTKSLLCYWKKSISCLVSCEELQSNSHHPFNPMRPCQENNK